jgi:hypothetical protein
MTGLPALETITSLPEETSSASLDKVTLASLIFTDLVMDLA